MSFHLVLIVDNERYVRCRKRRQAATTGQRFPSLVLFGFFFGAALGYLMAGPQAVSPVLGPGRPAVLVHKPVDVAVLSSDL